MRKDYEERIMRTKNAISFVGLMLGAVASQSLLALPSQVPIFLRSGTESLVMLNMSNDHELFFKAYDDYSDIDGDQPGGDSDAETTYENSVDYYGYFGSWTCYSYSSGEFVPQSVPSGDPSTWTDNDKYCNGGRAGDWSGNFLNWATMTRMDAIRKVLYGGYRSTDTATKTVLERTFLPTDAHSFVKYYNQNDVGKLTPYTGTDISICNTTQSTANNSKDATDPPLMRVAQGNYSMWTAHARVQCQWSGENNTSNDNVVAITGIPAFTSPPSATATGSAQYIVRVEVCKNATLAEDNCRVYPAGNRKPIGTLQEHGEDGSVKFGLITGSYQKNKSGGVLRKNVGTFADEVNETTNGTFSAPPANGGIVDTLNKLRLTRYRYDDDGNVAISGNSHRYNDLDSCTFAQLGFADGECSNWGNPQSEIYLESLRYFAGLTATSAFAANDTGFINGLGTATWSDPLSNSNYCAPVNIIHFNASTSSFDGDQLGGFSSLPGSPSADTWTDAVGAGGVDPNITNSGNYFVGEVAGTTSTGDRSCTPKDLDNLSDATGICPEAPWLEGTYQIAGMAYYANQNSIRTNLTDVDGNTADIFVKTYGVALSPAQPIIRVPPVTGSNFPGAVILPACMEYRNAGTVAGVSLPFRHNGNCGLVDFRIVDPHTEVGGVGTGKFMVLWESAQAGGDYDQDMGGIIEYSITANDITVTTDVYTASTGGIHGFGYVISGTTQDGLHIHSGHNNFDDYADPYGLKDCVTLGGCSVGDGPEPETYTLGTTVATPLNTPLYYAAKWGGFKEEADAGKRPPGAAAPNAIPDQNYEWDADADGQPDNYFFARNPGQLSSQLATVFQLIGGDTSSASVVANTVSLQTTTRIYQARFDADSWVGKLLAFPVTVSSGALQAHDWDAGEVIAMQDYDTGRAFLTWNSTTATGVAFRWDDNGTPANLADDITGLSVAQRTALNLNPDTALDDGLGPERLDYLRGDDSNELAQQTSTTGPFFRNRIGKKDVPGPGGAVLQVSYWTPLGDVVHSTPSVVAKPSFGYSDSSYADFVRQYGDSECFQADGVTPITSWTAGSGGPTGSAGGREPIVYFGSNGGALHGVSACTGHERLAFVPNSVFDDLGKLTSLNYSHQYYVDGPPTVVDAYFSSDSAWHTVAIGSLRGGGQSLFALDVTDPNDFSEANASSLVLWEIEATPLTVGSDFEELGYTFSQPAIVKAEGHGWVAVFGNGYHGKSGRAVLYLVDIESGALLKKIDVGGTNNGLSTVSPIDRDGDGDVDLIYAGDLNGNVWRFAATTGVGFDGTTTTLLYAAKSENTLSASVAQPITSRLAVGLHPTSAIGRIVYFGTGKYYEPSDQDPANAVQYNSMYGIWDRDDGSTVPSVTARNSDTLQQQTVTTETVGTFGTNSYEVRVISNTPVTWVTRNAGTGLWNTCSSTGSCGWYLDLTDTGEKMVSQPILRGGRLIFVTTIPSLVACAAGGTGWLMEIDPYTGGRMDIPLFDLNGDGVFDYKDNLAQTSGGNTIYTPISGKKSKVGILQPPAILAGVGGAGDGSYGGAEGKYSSGTQDAQIEVTIENPTLLGAGRKSWARVK
jgi:type IV pilus assembly protein PilY1